MLGMRILFASGAALIRIRSNDSSWMGNEAWTEALEWPGAEKFHGAFQKNFTVKSNGEIGGVYKGAAGLTFMRVKPA
jgi:carboxypeptidase C (cathepsin A)